MLWMWNTLASLVNFAVRASGLYDVVGNIFDGKDSLRDRLWEMCPLDQPTNSFALQSAIWKFHAPPIALCFLWRVCLAGLPTRENLLYRNIITSLQDVVCPFCSDYLETDLHLFSAVNTLAGFGIAGCKSKMTMVLSRTPYRIIY
ncbi:hypothetical protein Fmac_019898 [Flemingia macrophylla]|uniref:Reverse transcriptase zinc-binding domain-containing protein n=1 Tax=Flemingia macrophylla TaxID=520843 RepID=A0ABD1M999_9FABA